MAISSQVTKVSLDAPKSRLSFFALGSSIALEIDCLTLLDVIEITSESTATQYSGLNYFAQ
jgi:hypothetical protein